MALDIHTVIERLIPVLEEEAAETTSAGDFKNESYGEVFNSSKVRAKIQELEEKCPEEMWWLNGLSDGLEQRVAGQIYVAMRQCRLSRPLSERLEALVVEVVHKSWETARAHSAQREKE